MNIHTRIAQELERLDDTVDGLGLGLDAGIRRTVALMNIAGLQTSGSCEGHLDRGLPFPWIDIETTEPGGWEEDMDKQTKWYIENMRQGSIALRLLADFYSSRKAPLRDRLALNPMGLYGAMRLEPIGGEWPKNDDETKEEALKAKQDEMNLFTQFLEDCLSEKESL